MLKITRTLPELYLPLIRYDRSEDDYEITSPINILREFRKKTLFLGIPGAFFPSILWKFLPEYKRYGAEVKELCQVTQIAVVTVNDPFVLKTFAEEIDGNETFTFISDFNAELSSNLGTLFEQEGVGRRSKAFRFLLKDGEIKDWVCEEDWSVTSLTRPFKLMREHSPHLPYPRSVYPD
jgi:peroxiredoxin